MGYRTIVIVDTNFFALLQQGINFVEMVEELLLRKPTYVILDKVLDEVKRLASRMPWFACAYEKILQCMIRSSEVEFFESDVSAPGVDRAIEIVAREFVSRGAKVYVASNDRDLRRRLRASNIPTIYLRESEMRLECEGLYCK